MINWLFKIFGRKKPIEKENDMKDFQGDIKKSKRKITRIIIHCSATPPTLDIGVKEITQWHKQRGWSTIGYHYVVRRDGRLEVGRSINRNGAHTKGYNTNSIGICMIGGVDMNEVAIDNFTDEQWATMRRLLKIMQAYYSYVTIHGHNEFANKACPSFDVQEELTKRLK